VLTAPSDRALLINQLEWFRMLAAYEDVRPLDRGKTGRRPAGPCRGHHHIIAEFDESDFRPKIVSRRTQLPSSIRESDTWMIPCIYSIRELMTSAAERSEMH
jgi:hypothetical protein